MNRKYLLLLGFLLIAALHCQSQVQINGIGSFLQGSGYYDNHAYLIGGGVSGQYMIQERYYIGATARTYKANTTAYEHFNAQDRLSTLSGNIDVVFRKRKPLQPYLGLGVGVSRSTHMLRFQRTYQNFTMYSVRGGTYIALGKSTGFFAQAQYSYTPDTPALIWDGNINPVIAEPISKFVTLDFGLYVRLYIAK